MSSAPTINWVNGEGASYRLGPGSTYSASASNDGVLYLFMDESGNLDFGKNGSSYFYMTCLSVRRQFSLEMPLTSLRYDFRLSTCFAGNGSDAPLHPRRRREAMSLAHTTMKQFYGLFPLLDDGGPEMLWVAEPGAKTILRALVALERPQPRREALSV